MRYATVETVTLSPIPCWSHLSPELYRARIAALVESIESREDPGSFTWRLLHLAGQADTAIRWHVTDRGRRFLCRRHKMRVSGTSRFGYAEVYGT
jgi:hypothetical protein